MDKTKQDIENEYEKNADLKREHVEILQKWSEESTKVPNLNEFQAILFLQSCHGDMTAAKKAVEVFFEVKRANPRIFLNRNPNSADLMKAMGINLMVPLPQLTKEGYQIIFIRLMDADPAKYVYPDFVKLMDMVAMLMLYQNGTNKGLISVIDQTGYGFRHLVKISLSVMKTTLHYVQEGMPIRLKGVHFFNIHAIIEKVFALMRPFVKKDVMDLIKAHSNIETMFEFVPKECLPSDYGGGAPSLKELHDNHQRILKDNAAIFEQEEELINKNGSASIPIPNDTKNNSILQRTLQNFGFR